ncbi:MAG: hypothetical protein HZA50_14900 [Planctomycetes bacterium]|nr:hypothetical protein [Planctomycetota bacterium]
MTSVRILLVSFAMAVLMGIAGSFVPVEIKDNPNAAPVAKAKSRVVAANVQPAVVQPPQP